MIRACVIGWPIRHSRSPLIHRYWLKSHDIAGSYERIAVEPGGAGEFISALSDNGFAGCNVTIPHKMDAFAAVSVADETTRQLGVVNTVYLRDGVAWGISTDGMGFLASVRDQVPGWSPRGMRVVMLGAGGAARAIAGMLLAEGCEDIAIVNRNIERAEELRRSFGKAIEPLAREKLASALAGAEFFVNTTSLGMAGQPPLQFDLSHLAPHAIVADIVYSPLETPLIREARARRHVVVPGLGMLLHQAVKGFSLWFGVTPEVTRELYDLIAVDIENPGTQL